ncbi:MAG: hypothetical protein HEQ21_06750 [Blastomonas sp.]|uniref:hypothetical protein n=1 Tax=Blastomonas sp. TaxID=1909299 RepID=UPI00258E800F|nr:hypothetical protein [Blastomonas sp.]MCO5792501.1 hypothetical protein [Blastomonas sp.]
MTLSDRPPVQTDIIDPDQAGGLVCQYHQSLVAKWRKMHFHCHMVAAQRNCHLRRGQIKLCEQAEQTAQ